MKKGKITMTITIGIAFFVLVLILFMQFKVVYQTDITSIDTMREEDLKSELASWKSKYEDAEKKYEEVAETLKKYNEESTTDIQTKKNLEEELEDLKLMLGVTDVEGQGVIIRLKNPDNLEETDIDGIENTKQRVSASELMIIINYLKDAGAEAISINNQRVVNKTDIVDIGDVKPFIKMNSQRITAPFEIKAIGDPDHLKSALIGTGYVENIKSWGQEITFEEPKNKKVEIKKYEGNMDIKYIEN